MSEFFNALGFLTVFPVGRKENFSFERMVVFFPLVGLVYGGIVFGWVKVAEWFFFPEQVVVWGMVAIPLFVNGFLHFDGWCDSWDALLPVASSERRLEILKDSRIGVFGMSMGVLLLLLRVAVYPFVMRAMDGAWVDWVVSRGVMVLMAYGARYPRSSGTALGLVGKVSVFSLLFVLGEMITALGVACVIKGSLAPFWIGGVVGVGMVGLRSFASRRLGGITGDILGAAAELSEVLAACVWGML